MPRPGGALLLLALTAVAAPPPAAQPLPPLQPGLHGRFLHITDFHPDDFYRAHSSPARGVACHRGSGSAGLYGAETTDCDSPWSLVDATFAWIAANVRDRVDFVVWTGDSARHDSDEKHPRSAAQVLASNRAVADRFARAFGPGPGRPAIPVVPTFGNNDFLPHNIMNAGPNRWFQAYGDIWRPFIPEEQRHSFEFGGWFYVEVIPDRLAVFSLNTMFFFDRNAAVDGCAEPSEPGYHHMEWLRIQLQRMRDRGLKAILMGHVPPARTDSKRNWDETCWQRYTLWLRQFRDVVTASLFGHMNIDHFLLHDANKVDWLSEEEEEDLPLDDHLSAQSKQDYLEELRDEWADLPDSVIGVLDDDNDNCDGDTAARKKHKNKYGKIGGKHAERYQLSLVSPSIVPNYLPTLRVFEYNMSGLEQAALWADSRDAQPAPLPVPDQDEEEHLELKRDIAEEGKKKKKKKKKNKGHKGNKGHKDPNFILPEAPPKDSPPGPAYYMQPLTLTGYVQYYANLTHINNDGAAEDVAAAKWRGGRGHQKPKHPPEPNRFRYEVEYSTFDDDVYKLRDLTVKSYLHLAYRMGEKKGKGRMLGEDDDDDEVMMTADDDEMDCDGGVDARRKHKKGKGKKGKKKKQREGNKTWLHFLGHAFVKTVPEEELEMV